MFGIKIKLKFSKGFLGNYININTMTSIAININTSSMDGYKCYKCNKFCKNKTGMSLHLKTCGVKKANNQLSKSKNVTKTCDKKCIVCKKKVENGEIFKDCKKVVHHGCQRLNNVVHCTNVFCRTEIYNSRFL
jgi:hypothetical protein